MPLDNPPSDDLDPIYEEAGQRFGHDPDWLRSVANVESAGNRYAISPAGAVGTMQAHRLVLLTEIGNASDKVGVYPEL